MHPGEDRHDPQRHRVDDRPEERPAVRVCVVEPVTQGGQPPVLQRPHVHVIAEVAAGRHRERRPHRRAIGDFRRALLEGQGRREEILGLDRHPLERPGQGRPVPRLERAEGRLLRLGRFGHDGELAVIEQRVRFDRAEPVAEAHDQHRPGAAQPDDVAAHSEAVFGGVERVGDRCLRATPSRREREGLTRLADLHGACARRERQVGERGRVGSDHEPVHEQGLPGRYQLDVAAGIAGGEGVVLQQLGPHQPGAARAEAEPVERGRHPHGLRGGLSGGRADRWTSLPRAERGGGRRGPSRCALGHRGSGQRGVRRTARPPDRRFRWEQHDRQGDHEQR